MRRVLGFEPCLMFHVTTSHVIQDRHVDGNYKLGDSVPERVSSPLAMSTGREKLLGNSLLVLKNKILQIFIKPKPCVWALHYRSIKQKTNQNKTPRFRCYSQKVNCSMIK